jgi:mycofactocin system creatininase family protein
LTWPDVAAGAGAALLAVPVGSTEQHGPHLTLSTDTDIAVALARRLAARRSDVMVAPAVPYGSSGEHAGFPGTLSIGQDALELVLVELVRSADAFAGVVVVSAHGGNARPVRRAVDLLSAEGRRVLAWSPPAPANAGGDTHAGWIETSVLLALDADAVRMERAECGSMEPIGRLWPRLVSAGVAAVSPNGVLGDPSTASAETGRRLLDQWTESLLDAVQGMP